MSDDRERVRAEKAAQRAAAAAEKDRAKARRAAERVAAAEAREREKNARAVERGLAALAGGKLKLKQITAVVGSALAAAPLGRALRDAFDQGVKDDARGVTPLLHTVEDLPVDFPAMTWRAHAPSDEPVGPDGEPRFASESRARGGVGGGDSAAADARAGVRHRRVLREHVRDGSRGDDDGRGFEPQRRAPRVLASVSRRVPGSRPRDRHRGTSKTLPTSRATRVSLLRRRWVLPRAGGDGARASVRRRAGRSRGGGA